MRRKRKFTATVLIICLTAANAAYGAPSRENQVKENNYFEIEESGKTYYVDAYYGADDNDGTAADPFKRIQQAIDEMQPGDTCLVREGVYSEEVTIGAGGTEGEPITLRNYPGEKVVISGCDQLSGWEEDSSRPGEGIYKTSMDWSLGDNGDKNQLFLNGEIMYEARYPNVENGSILTNFNYAKAGTGTGFTGSDKQESKLADPSFKTFARTADFFDGAKIWMVPGSEWTALTSYVDRYDPETGIIVFPSTYRGMTRSAYTPKPGNPYYLFGTKTLLDAEMEWWYDQENREIYVKIPGGMNPDTADVYIEAKAREHALDLSGSSYVNVTGIDLRGSTLITDEESSHILIKNLNGAYVGHCSTVEMEESNECEQDDLGILIKGSFIEVNSCEIFGSSGPVINIQGTDNRLINCYVHDGNYFGTYAGHAKITGRRHFVSNNTFCESGRDTVSFRNLAESVLQYNDIYGAGRLTKDLGVIYTAETDGQNTLIHHNYIHDNYTKSNNMGLYLDEMSNNFIVFNNVIFNSVTSMTVNQPSMYDLLYNNTGYNTNKLSGDYQQSYPDERGRQYLNNMMNRNDSGAYSPSTTFARFNINETDHFENPGDLDFRLQEGSKGIGAAMPLQGVTPDGVINPSAGAYQPGDELFKVGHDFENPPEIMEALSVEAFEYRNRVINGGFEYGTLESWEGEAEVVYDVSWHSANKKSATCSYGAILQSGDGISQTVPVEPYAQYTIGLIARAPQTAGEITISVNDMEAAVLADPVSTGNWSKTKNKYLTFTVGNVTEVTFTIENSGDSEFYLDDVGFQKNISLIGELSNEIELTPTDEGCTVRFNELPERHSYYYSDNRKMDQEIKVGEVQIRKPAAYDQKLESGVTLPWKTWEYLNVVEIVEDNVVGFGAIQKPGEMSITQITACDDVMIRDGSEADKVQNVMEDDDGHNLNNTLYHLNLNKSNLAGQTSRGYLQFDLSEMEPENIDEAKLQFYIFQTNPDEDAAEGGGMKRTIVVNGVDGEKWDEDSLTWNTALYGDHSLTITGELGRVSSIPKLVPPRGMLCELDVTEYIKNKTEDGFAAVQLTPAIKYIKGNMYISTKENPEYQDDEYLPHLEILYKNPIEVVPATGVILNKTEISLKVGESAVLKATVKPIDGANQNVTWRSSDETVASADENGKVTGLRNGTAVITVTTEDGGFTADCTITVGDGISRNMVTVEHGLMTAINGIPCDIAHALVEQGSTVSIQADKAAVDEQFTGWRVIPATVELNNAEAEETMFIMPDSPVTVIAEYANTATPANARAVSKATPKDWYAMAGKDSLDDLLNDDEIITGEDEEKLEKGWNVEVVLGIKKRDNAYKATPANAIRAELTEEEVGFFVETTLKKTVDWKGSEKKTVILDEAVNPVELSFVITDDLTGKQEYRLIGIAAGEEEAGEYDFSWDETELVVTFMGEVNGLYALVYDTSIIEPDIPEEPDEPDVPDEPDKPVVPDEPERPSRHESNSPDSEPANKWKSDHKGWKYRKNGSYVTSSWELINWNGRQNWYYFGTDGYMLTGWYLDHTGNWYYLNTNSDGNGGSMVTGWHLIAGKWYYFKEISDGTKGSLLINTVTPDGCNVGADGAWIS